MGSLLLRMSWSSWRIPTCRDRCGGNGRCLRCSFPLSAAWGVARVVRAPMLDCLREIECIDRTRSRMYITKALRWGIRASTLGGVIPPLGRSRRTKMEWSWRDLSGCAEISGLQIQSFVTAVCVASSRSTIYHLARCHVFPLSWEARIPLRTLLLSCSSSSVRGIPLLRLQSICLRVLGRYVLELVKRV